MVSLTTSLSEVDAAMHSDRPPNGWGIADAAKHTYRGDTPSLRRTWCAVANAVYEETRNEGLAVRAANAAVVSERRHSDRLGTPEEDE